MNVSDRWETCENCGSTKKTWLDRAGWLRCLKCGRKIRKYIRDEEKTDDKK